MRKLPLLAALLFPVAAQAQTACPSIVGTTITWTTAQWNACFASLGAAANGLFTNPVISAPLITGGSIAATSVTPAGGIGNIVVVATSSAAIVPGPVLNETIVVSETTPAATSVTLPAAANWPACPSATATSCPVYTVKDGAGNAATFPIVVTTADAKTIDGAISATISTNYGAQKFILNGTQWNVVP
jgi:hypothetical protein